MQNDVNDNDADKNDHADDADDDNTGGRPIS